MKKLLLIVLVACMALASLACSTPAEEAQAEATETAVTPTPEPTETAQPESVVPVAEVVTGVDIPAFTIDVNGTGLESAALADYPVYSVQTTSTNNSGTETTYTYVGYAVSDVLSSAGIDGGYTTVEATADDGYSTSVDADVAAQNTTLLAVTRDGEPFGSAPWFAPCSSRTTGDYLKNVVSLTTDAEAAASADTAATEGDGEASATAGPSEISDVTDKVEFADFSFLVNGEEVTNSTLEGLSIYKITAAPENKEGHVAESTYCGYKLADVLAACGITDYTAVTVVANDGYESELAKDVADSDYTLAAIEKDQETGEDGTIWVAPCESTSTSDYAKMVVEIKAT